MRMKLMAILVAGVMIMGLTGCGMDQIPEMTDEQMRLIGEYTAITVMKYDANNRSRLVDYSRMIIGSEPETPQEQETQEPAGMDPVDDTPVVGGPAGGNGAGPYSMEEALSLPEGVSIVYTGEALHDTYPEEGDFTITAAAGKQLLVLEFVIINASGQDQPVDFLTLSPEFRITVNEDYTRRAMLTMLDEDLSVYQGMVPSMGSVSTMLIIEVDNERAANLSSISLSVKNGSEAYSIQLL